jgi:REP element-mobilizing transposase RayT
MPRTARVAPGGMVFHVLNRGVARMQLFEKAGDYQAFERVLKETLAEAPMRICAYCLMPSHWHMLLWPEHDGDLPRFMQRLTITHVRRWQEHRRYVGLGHVYQGRYKSFPLEEDAFFGRRAVCRAERAAGQLGGAGGRVALVESLEAWLWDCRGKGGLGRMAVGDAGGLAGARQPGRQRTGVGSVAPQRPARASLRGDRMAEADCRTSEPGIGVSPAGSAKHRATRREI